MFREFDEASRVPHPSRDFKTPADIADQVLVRIAYRLWDDLDIVFPHASSRRAHAYHAFLAAHVAPSYRRLAHPLLVFMHVVDPPPVHWPFSISPNSSNRFP